MNTYIALLRGINVGGNKLVKMDDLKKAFAALGFKNIKTLLASGNVIFETSPENQISLAKKIEDKLRKTFGHEIPVILRSSLQLEALNKKNPFKNIVVTPATRLYVTFLSEAPSSKLKIPYQSPDGNFKILSVSKTEVCSLVTLSPEVQTTDLMDVLEKEFGKKVTTRNWNTVQKIIKLTQS